MSKVHQHDNIRMKADTCLIILRHHTINVLLKNQLRPEMSLILS